MSRVRAEFTIPIRRSKGKSSLARFNQIGNQVSSYDIDSAMDTDTDTWQIQLGIDDPTVFVPDMLDRDTEVRVNLYAVGHGTVETLHSGFADEIVLDGNGIMNVQGRDITAVAVDSQHPPQIWHGVRPEVLVAREARALKIGDRLKLTKAKGFKSYATDGSESYWQVWYRFYRKRRMWMWAEADSTLNAMTLNYNQPITYYFGEAGRPKNIKPTRFIPVESVEWRSTKSQRVGEVYYFGHRGDIGFVGSAVDNTTGMWIKRPTLIIASGDAHNQAEARVEAWEEIFESKVGAVEITLTIYDPGFQIRQDRMAFVNLPSIGLAGEYYVVGARAVGSVSEGFYQVIRLREKNYAISRRVPTDPTLRSGQSTGGADNSTIAGALDTGASKNLNQYFVNAAQKFHGPWPLDLFLGVLLSICSVETGFRNERRGSHTEYPGTDNGQVPPRGNTENKGAWDLFVNSFANERKDGHVSEDYAVGYMQLLTEGFKLYADRLYGRNIGDELLGGRWDAESNIMAGAAALASHLGAGVSISPDGHLTNVKPSGLSLQPSEANIWQGVGDYGEGKAYALKVRTVYNSTFKTEVTDAFTNAAQADVDAQSTELPGGSAAVLRQRVLNNSMITFTRQSQRDDIRNGLIKNHVLVFLLWFTDAGWPVTITALRTDHSTYTTENRQSAHSWGGAVDMGNYGFTNPKTDEAMKFIATYQKVLQFDQMIGPNPALVIPLGFYDQKTLDEHKDHIHMGWSVADT